MPQVAAVLLAGGSGSRVQRDINKVYLPIGDRQMLSYSLETLERARTVDRVVIVVREEDRGAVDLLVAEPWVVKPTMVVAGGPTRHQSEHHALEAIGPEIESEIVTIVAIHDGARPFMTGRLLDRVVEEAREVGGAIPVLGVEEDLFRVDGSGARLLDPGHIRKAQTPQAFRAQPLLRAYRAAAEAAFQGVDTAETVAAFSELQIAAVPGEQRNIKVTFVEDLFRAEDIAPDWEHGGWRSSP